VVSWVDFGGWGRDCGIDGREASSLLPSVINADSNQPKASSMLSQCQCTLFH